MDYFAEYMLRRKKTGRDKLMCAAYILGALLLTAGIAFIALFTGKFMVMIWFTLVVALWVLCYFMIRKQNIEYEYVFTNGILDIDVIYAKSNRKTLVSLRATEIRHCARRDDARFEKQYDTVPKHLLLFDATTNTPGSKVYYADFLYNAEATRLLFEPNKKILEMMRKYNPKHVHIYEEEQAK